jgi:hypothetical protein
MNKKNYSDKVITRHHPGNFNNLNNFLPAFLVNDLNPNDMTNFSNNFEYLDTNSTNSKNVKTSNF